MADDPQNPRGEPSAMPLDPQEANDLDSLLTPDGAAARAPAAAAPAAQAGPGMPPAEPPPMPGAAPATAPDPAPGTGFSPSQVQAYPTLPPSAIQKGGPGWGVAIIGTVAGLALGAGATALVMPGADTSSGSVASGSPRPSTAPAPPTSASSAPAPLGPIELAARGDEQALQKLSDKPPGERTVEETLAVGEGRRATKILKMQKLAKTLKKSPDLASDDQLLKRLRADAKDAEIAPSALRILASLPGPGGADVLYDIWVGTRGRTSATETAEGLVFTKEVRAKASDALAVALDLRSTTECEEVQKVVERAKEHGDARSLPLLGKLMRRFGCGEKKNEDCYPCLRQGTGKVVLKDALKETRKRPGPRF